MALGFHVSANMQYKGRVMKRIDCHGHIMFENSMGKAKEFGPRIVKNNGTYIEVGPYRSVLPDNYADDMFGRNDPDSLVCEMDSLGIDMLNVMASPLFYLYWASLEIAVDFIKLHNDLLHELASARPDRLFWSAILPLQDVNASIEEAKRVASMGASCITIGTDNLGLGDLDDEVYFPLYEVISNLGLTIVLHPYPTPMKSGAKDRYNLSWITGYPNQETMAFATLTLGGVLDEFPKLKFYLTHGGGAVPYLFGRIAAAHTTKLPGVKAKKPLEEYLDRFWFDTTVHDPRALEFLLRFMGEDRIIVGSNYSGWNWSNEFDVVAQLGLDDDQVSKIFHRNAETLFGLTSNK